MKVWITKYALTDGIVETEVEDRGNDIVLKKGKFPTSFDQYFHKPDWHTSYDAALKRADKMRQAKVASLEKSLKKIRALSFATPPADATAKEV